MAPLVLASEVKWGDAGTSSSFDGRAEEEMVGLSPSAKQPLSRMSEEEQQVDITSVRPEYTFIFVFCLRVHSLLGVRFSVFFPARVVLCCAVRLFVEGLNDNSCILADGMMSAFCSYQGCLYRERQRAVSIARRHATLV